MASESSTHRHKQSVKIIYAHPGAQPPVFVAASFTSSPWQPHEMQYISQENTEELEFYKEFYDVDAGEYQYKFRLGLGDWWVLNDNAPKATDDAGNLNNILTVLPQPSQERTDESTPSNAGDQHIMQEASRELEVTPGLAAAKENSEAPATSHDTTENQLRPTADNKDSRSLQQDAVNNQATEPDAVSELGATDVDAHDKDTEYCRQMSGSTLEQRNGLAGHGDGLSSEPIAGEASVGDVVNKQSIPDGVSLQSDKGTLHTDETSCRPAQGHLVGERLKQTVDSSFEEPRMLQEPSSSKLDLMANNSPTVGSSSEPKTLADYNPGFAAALAYKSPESGSPRIEHAPLFSHESFSSGPDDSISGTVRQPAQKPASTLRQVQDAEDFDYPLLEPFPTERDDILDTIHSTEERLKEDETRTDGTPPSPVVNSQQSPELAIVRSLSHTSLGASPKPALEAIPESISDAAALQAENSTAAPQDLSLAVTEEPTQQITLGSPLTPPLTPKTAKAVMLNGVDQDTVSPDEESTRPEASAQITTDADTTQQQSSDDGLRLRKPTPSSDVRSASPPSGSKDDEGNEGIIRSVWRALFGSWLGPLMHWLVGFVGVGRKAT